MLAQLFTGLERDRRAAARLLGPVGARAGADRAGVVAPAPDLRAWDQARARSVLLPLPAEADLSVVRHRVREGHRRAHPHDDQRARRGVSSRSRSRASAGSSRRRRSTSRSRCRSCASTAASSSATRCRPGFGRTGGAFWGIAHWGVVPGRPDDGEGASPTGCRSARRPRGPRSPRRSSRSRSHLRRQPVSCAAANATIAILEGEDLPAKRGGHGAAAPRRSRGAPAALPAHDRATCAGSA
jgi:hypothetical protein